MPKRSLLVGLCLLLLAVLAFLFWPRGSARTRPTDQAVTGSAATPPAAAAATAHADAAPQAGEQRSEIETTDPNAPVYEVRGKVLGELRTPVQGAKVQAFAGKASDRRGTFRNIFGSGFSQMDKGAGEDMLLRTKGRPLAETEVADDGSFRLTVRQRYLRLALDHDFYALASPEVVHVPRDRRAIDVVLVPHLGGCIRGRLMGPGADTIESIRLAIEPDPMSVMQNPDRFLGTVLQAARDPVKPGADGTFAYRAVLPSARIRLWTVGGSVIARTTVTGLAPGETREVALAAEPVSAIAVTVTTAEGAPVEQASVRAEAQETRGMIGGDAQSQKSKTDAEGRCTIAHLPPGAYTVTAEANGHSNGRAEATVTADRPAEAVIRLGTGGTASGVVVDPDGNAVAGARVGHAMNIELPLIGDLAEQLGADFLTKAAGGDDLPRTGSDGRFALTGLGYDAPFVVVARHDDFAPGMLKQVRVGATDLRIQLERPASITGKVVAAETGEPLAEFEVETQAMMFMALRRTVRQENVTGSTDGVFRFTNVTPGDFTLVVAAEDRSETKKSLRVAAGAAIDVGTVAVPRGAVVKGFVRDEHGEPVRSAIVRLKHGGLLDNPILAVLSGSLVARTDDDGRFTLEGLSPGNLLLQTSSEGYASARSERIRLEAGQTVEGVTLVLGHGGSIRGRLIAGVGERPEEFQLYVKEQQSQDTKIVMPAADGTFQVANLDPGPYEVQGIHPLGLAAMQGGQDAELEDGKSLNFKKMMTTITDSVVTQRCVVQAGEATEVTIDASDLGLGTRLTVQVLIGDKPIGDGMIELVTLADGQVRTAFLDGGECVFAGLRPGAFRAQARAGITLTPIGGPEDVTIPPNATNHRAVLRLPGGELRGRVVDVETGEPLPAVLVRLLHEDRRKDDPLGVAFTDAKGEFGFRALAEGSYSLVAADDFSNQGRGAARAENLRVNAGQVTGGIVLHARPAAGVTATVTNEAGTSIPGALVLCVDEQGQPLGTGGIAVSGSDGKAILGGLTGGRARAIARAPGLAPGASDLQDLEPGGHAEFTVRLALGTRVVLEATDRSGRKLAGADVTARCNQGPWFPALLLLERRNQDGGLELGRLTPGDWEFRLDHPATGTFTVRRSVGSGAAVTILATPP